MLPKSMVHVWISRSHLQLKGIVSVFITFLILVPMPYAHLLFPALLDSKPEPAVLPDQHGIQ